MQEDRVRDKTSQDATRENRATPTTTPKRPWRRWSLTTLGIVLGVPTIIIAAWTAIVLNRTYSRGYRAGFIQKFSQKGWICKTWEGDLAIVNIPGSAPEHFIFTVRDDSVANQITHFMGARVTLTYEQHPGVPTSCFGDTEYYVTGVKAIP